MPLKVPITGNVIRQRMDNNGYLEGRSKDELVMWARKFVVDDAVGGESSYCPPQDVNGKELSKEEWESAKPRLSSNMKPRFGQNI